ncbi:MAG: PepSY domain-containing protein [Proteobacteria bacterium]|nr:PepSY domain-containing protein [Pseudomonadota bacterium]
MSLIKSISAAAMLGFALAQIPHALASEDIDPALKAKVTAEMTAKGYDVRKVQMEDGKIEVYAVKDGKTLEIYLDDKLQILKSDGEEDGDQG